MSNVLTYGADPPSLRVLGIDPAIVACGITMLEVRGTSRRCISAEVLRQNSSVPPAERIETIGRRVAELVTGVDLVVVEDQVQVFWGMHAQGRTNANVARLMGLVELLRGVALVTGREFIALSPGQIRKRLGLPPKASKKDLEWAVRIRVKGFPKVGEDAVDAGAVALAGEAEWRARALRVKSEPVRPKSHVRTRRHAQGAAGRPSRSSRP